MNVYQVICIATMCANTAFCGAWISTRQYYWAMFNFLMAFVAGLTAFGVVK